VSYRIEITADTLAELAGKTASLAAMLNSNVDNGVALVSASHPVNATVGVPEDISPAALETVEVEAPAAAPTLDYKSQVAPLVLKLVEVCGKPAAQRVLDQFGAAKASDIAPERWPELIGMINAEMAQ